MLDLNGRVIGVVVGKLDALKVARATGDIPQNVNFAVKASVVRNLLDANGVEHKSASPGRTLSAADVGELARKFTVRIECWN
ncbi:MAG: hypothetical protein FJX65_19230 [Alphaproteobacteria bacterium]|nr:hypothetical protein [Alphaproteobacteria bacterium]